MNEKVLEQQPEEIDKVESQRLKAAEIQAEQAAKKKQNKKQIQVEPETNPKKASKELKPINLTKKKENQENEDFSDDREELDIQDDEDSMEDILAEEFECD